MEQHQSLSLDGKTILSSSSGPTSPEETSKHDETSPNIHTSSGINFSKSDTSSDDLQTTTNATNAISLGDCRLKGLLPSPEMLASFFSSSKKPTHSNKKALLNFPLFSLNETSSIMDHDEQLIHHPTGSSSPRRHSHHQVQGKNSNNTLNVPSYYQQSNNRITESSDCWRDFQKAAYANNLDPNVLALYQNHQALNSTANSESHTMGMTKNTASSGGGNKCQTSTTTPVVRRKNATRETTSMLKAWLNEHRKNPYPTKGEKIMLAIITKMSLTQVSTWFANARRRLKKENKVTWTIRSGGNFDGEDDDDDDEEEAVEQDLAEESDPDDEIMSSDDQLLLPLNRSGTRQKRTLDNHQQTTPDLGDEGVVKKKKIWSLVEMTQEDDDVEEAQQPHQQLQNEQNGIPTAEAIAKWLESSQLPAILAAALGTTTSGSSALQVTQDPSKFDPLLAHLKMPKASSFSS